MTSGELITRYQQYGYVMARNGTVDVVLAYLVATHQRFAVRPRFVDGQGFLYAISREAT